MFSECAIQTAGPIQTFSGASFLNGSGLRNLQDHFKTGETFAEATTLDSGLLSKALKSESGTKKEEYWPDNVEAVATALPGAVASALNTVFIALTVGGIAGATIGGAGAVAITAGILHAPVYASVLSGLVGGIGGGIGGIVIGLQVA